MLKKILLLSILALPCLADPMPQPLLVPGGIAEISVGDSRQPTPKLFYNGNRILVTERGGQWLGWRWSGYSAVRPALDRLFEQGSRRSGLVHKPGYS